MPAVRTDLAGLIVRCGQFHSDGELAWYGN